MTSRPENGSSSTSSWGSATVRTRPTRAGACLWRTPSSSCSGCRAAAAAGAAREHASGAPPLACGGADRRASGSRTRSGARRATALPGHSQSALVGDRIIGEPDAGERDIAGAWFEQPDNEVDGRTLAGSVGPEITDDLARARSKLTRSSASRPPYRFVSPRACSTAATVGAAASAGRPRSSADRQCDEDDRDLGHEQDDYFILVLDLACGRSRVVRWRPALRRARSRGGVRQRR